MTDRAAGRRFIPGWELLLLTGLAAAAVGLLLLSPVPASAPTELIRSLSAVRIGGGRLFGAPEFHEANYEKALQDAEVLLLSMPESVFRDRLRALVDLRKGRFREASETLQRLSELEPKNGAILNDLGVAHLALGKDDPAGYFTALTLFKRSKQLSPRAAEPYFNTVVAYRLADLGRLAAQEMDVYRRFENSAFWRREIPDVPTDSELMERLEAVLGTANAGDLVRQFAPTYGRLAMDHVLNPAHSPYTDSTIEFIWDALKDLYDGDATRQAMVEPLYGVHRQAIIESRSLVARGVEAYREARNEDSLQLYNLAQKQLGGTNSVFDELWVQLNRADSELRDQRGGPKVALPLFDHVIVESEKRNFKWLLGQAAAAKGVSLVRTLNYDETMPILSEAAEMLNAIGAPFDAARPVYYLAAVHSMAGDLETSLKLSYEGLRQTRPADQVRRAQSYWLAGLQLFRMGFEQYAVLLEEQAVAEAAGNRPLAMGILPSLSMMHAANGEYGLAEQQLDEMRAFVEGMVAPAQREILSLPLNILCSQINIGTGRLPEAKACLERNLEILDSQEFRNSQAVKSFLSQTLLQLAQVYSLKRDFGAARQAIGDAIGTVEETDAYFAVQSLRVSFENERRNSYDKAIAFEYDHGEVDAAWSYLQRYRSKLFIEFLKQGNRKIDAIQRDTFDRSRVQGLFPHDLQVVEYVMLQDRLLAWVVSDTTFATVPIAVSQKDIEQKVALFLKAINNQADVRKQSEELYRLLIEPIEPYLDRGRTLAIVPDRALHRLNFAALYSAKAKKHLIEEYELLESPNLTFLLSGGGTPRRGAAVAFGARTETTGETLELTGLKPHYDNFESFNGASAVKPAFLSSLDRAGVFHYSGHSTDAADPLRSAILLDGEQEGPNSVTALDISRRKMPVDSVVVLASCDSSVGNSRDGVGMRGLTSAFLISGAGSVVGSLWLVEASSTSRLVLDFHRDFARNGLSVAKALRQAQREFIDRGEHPYFWSGFVVTGNVSALR